MTEVVPSSNKARTLMPEVTIRPRVTDDDPAIVTIGHLLNPEYPKRTVEEYRASLESIPPDVNHTRVVAERDGDGSVLGWGMLGQMFWVEEPAYSTGIEVHPDHQGHGVGGLLYEGLLPQARAWQVRRLFAEIREDDERSRKFATDRGFDLTGHVERVSRLDVRTVKLDDYGGLEERLRDEGIRAATLAEIGMGDEDRLRAVHRMQIAAAQDEPASEHLNLSFERWRDFFIARPGVSPDAIWVAVAGDKPIGITMLEVVGGNSAWHFGMGVDRTYRGRGVARLLKLRTIEWARQSGIDFLYTGNDINNPRMYDINMRLGYQPLPGSVEMVKELTA